MSEICPACSGGEIQRIPPSPPECSECRANVSLVSCPCGWSGYAFQRIGALDGLEYCPACSEMIQ
jgi:hypothetical protein